MASRPAFATIGAAFAVGTTGAFADTHTGYHAEIICDSGTTTVVTPTSPAAASQDVSSTNTIVFAVGAFLQPDRFPAGKVVYRDFNNLATGN